MEDTNSKGGKGLPAWAGEKAALYRNKKNGKLYVLLAKAVDCTNERDGLPVVVYCPQDDPAFVSVREEREFLAKFDPA